MRISTQAAKARGRRLQQHVAKFISYVFRLGEGDCVSRPMGSPGIDIMMSPKAREACPVSVECKSLSKQPTFSQIQQSINNAHPGTLPILAYKPRGQKYNNFLVICRGEDFFPWLEKLTREDSDANPAKE